MSVNTTSVTHPALLDLPIKMLEIQTKLTERMMRIAAHEKAAGSTSERLLDVVA